MEYFYREMRRKHKILLQPDGEPEGGRWNYDAENRKGLKKNPGFRARRTFTHDAITNDVIALVEANFPDHFGTIEPFGLAVTREQALQILDDFILYDLPEFGTYQDAMLTDEPFLHHAHISFYMNIGLLQPLEVIKAVEAAYYNKHAPLSSVEGFIRQILGWREYMRGIYWLKMPGYEKQNFLNATLPLPAFYWTGETAMNCVASTVRMTQMWAYSHHIQRLMITGNLALLAGFDVEQVCEWYLAVYGDAYEWVELPNTLGMSLFGDGGVIASKPYAASGNYINKQSDFCGKCQYDPKQSVGSDACPFNALYWNFLDKHRGKFERNPRMAPMYRTLDMMSAEKHKGLLAKAKETLTEFAADAWYKPADSHT